LGRPAKKKKYAEAKAVRSGELQAEYQFKKAHSIAKKPLDFIEEHGSKLLDKIEPLEAVAVIGLTVLVKHTIDSTEELLNKLQVIKSGKMKGLLIFRTEATTKFLEQYGYTAEGRGEGFFTDWQDWLISFCIAYIIIKHGGQLFGLMKDGAGTLVTVIGALMA